MELSYIYKFLNKIIQIKLYILTVFETFKRIADCCHINIRNKMDITSYMKVIETSKGNGTNKIPKDLPLLCI